MTDDLFRVEPEPDEPAAVLYQHTVLAQTCLPYRDPGRDVRRWQRSQGAARLEIEAGRAFCPDRDEFVDLGLPFGPKPRLILAHLNAVALRTRSPEIEVEASLTAFVRRIQGRSPTGPEIRLFKDQLARLATAQVRLAVAYNERAARQVQAHLIGEFDLWLPKGPGGRVLWPATVTLDPRYFISLTKHAVPLHEHALAALAHSAMALDLYAWLAQRLHRVDPARPAFVPWTALKEQFGQGYGRLRKFREVFKDILDLVLAQYQDARVKLDDRGMTLRHSPPPVLCQRSPIITGSKDSR
jgi:Plasmid encoded RepA protein